MNSKNISNLLKAYFIENWKTDLYQFGMLAAIVFFGALINGSNTYLNFSLFILVIFLMIYPERLFRNLHSNSPKIHYLTIPASNGEKIVTNMLLANIYYVVGLVMASALGLALAHLYMIARGYDGIELYNILDANTVLMIYTSLSIFFFGSIYFRKRTTISTIGVGLLIGTIFSIIIFTTIFVNGLTLIPEGSSFNDFIWNYDSTSTISESAIDAFPYIIMSAGIIYFYAMSFLRLKETEA